MRDRLAPSAVRSAISRERFAVRARSRIATLPHAISSKTRGTPLGDEEKGRHEARRRRPEAQCREHHRIGPDQPPIVLRLATDADGGQFRAFNVEAALMSPIVNNRPTPPTPGNPPQRNPILLTVSTPRLVSAVSVPQVALWQEFEPLHVRDDVAAVVRLR